MNFGAIANVNITVYKKALEFLDLSYASDRLCSIFIVGNGAEALAGPYVGFGANNIVKG